ncbi:hypothetical protein BC826DRAFT_1054035 [Russula brevipes]|nr:hypothetical protein BC826DRAFT_1054035 [Russula brevipes]
MHDPPGVFSLGPREQSVGNGMTPINPEVESLISVFSRYRIQEVNVQRPTAMMVDKNVTINCLPDDVLVFIFSLSRRAALRAHFISPVVWEWMDLFHVCRRWRRLIFASSRHLRLQLVIGCGVDRKLPRALDSWPWSALPISIWHVTSDSLSPDEDNDVATALEYSDRICEINFTVSSATISALMETSFPALTSVHLQSPGYRSTFVRSDFLGRFPSSGQLVSLSLGPGFRVGDWSLSPGALTAVLSAIPQLKDLNLSQYNVFLPGQGSAFSPSPDLVVLPSLTGFSYTGLVYYLEDLVSRIQAPLLEYFEAGFNGSTLDIPQLSQFISRKASLSSPPRRTYIKISTLLFAIEYDLLRDAPHPREGPSLIFSCKHAANEMSKVAHVCRQLSPLASGVRQLRINAHPWMFIPDSKSNAVLWLKLLAPFDSVQVFELCGEEGPRRDIAYALERCASGMTKEVLPALRILRLKVVRFGGAHAQSSIETFVAARERSGRPVTVYMIL